MAAARTDPFDLLACPVCGLPLRRAQSALRCPDGHSYDLARQGYAALQTGQRVPTADNAQMVRAREAFLGEGHYAPLAASVAAMAGACGARTVLDAGCGTGYYLAAVLDALPAAVGLGLDTSAAALRLAARAHPRAGAAGWDVWRPLPLPDRSIDLVLNVFAPRNGLQFRRVLRPGGSLVSVTPSQEHLQEIRPGLGMLAVDPEKDERLAAALGSGFDLVDDEPVSRTLQLHAAALALLVTMSPSARHTSPADLNDRLAGMRPPVEVTVSFRVRRYVAT